MQDNRTDGRGRPREGANPDTFAGRFGTLLRRLRDDAGLTGRQLAQASGVPYQTFVQYERGERSPPREAAGRLVAALGHSLAALDVLFVR